VNEEAMNRVGSKDHKKKNILKIERAILCCEVFYLRVGPDYWPVLEGSSSQNSRNRWKLHYTRDGVRDDVLREIKTIRLQHGIKREEM
jgi:hypothetical protein